MLVALSKLCNDKKRKIYIQAILTLFEILKTYGEQFPREFWKKIFHEVLKPLFNKSEGIMMDRKTSLSGGATELKIDNQPLGEIFSRVVDLHSYFRPKLDYFTKDMIELLIDCAQQPQEMVAKISINTIRFIINNCHASFSKEEWEGMIAAFKEIFEKTTPLQLLSYKIGGYEEKVTIYSKLLA